MDGGFIRSVQMKVREWGGVTGVNEIGYTGECLLRWICR